MLSLLSLRQLPFSEHPKVFKKLMIFMNGTTILIYTFVRVLVSDFSFRMIDEVVTVFKITATGSVLAILFYLVFTFIEFLDTAEGKNKMLQLIRHHRNRLLLFILLTLGFASCQAQTLHGVKKDFGTGLVASYTNIEPERVLLVMNDEVLGHTDIPLGETFMLVNENVKGFVQVDNKISVGCSLLISDEKGRAVLKDADLFKGHDTFHPQDARFLKCTISTGKPMDWEKTYTVRVVFWDKNGTGKIVNNLKIRIIDIP
ncbi:MAG TPA: hypothetical protein VHK91_05115 [Flavisolibacter sp.]|jgi:hypothetical protein|nr:hypothetical protein [Flavisolibacter sp.]